MVVCCHNNESAEFFGSKFYWHSVVGGNTYSIYTKMGARTHSAWRYNAYMDIYNYIYRIIYV